MGKLETASNKWKVVDQICNKVKPSTPSKLCIQGEYIRRAEAHFQGDKKIRENFKIPPFDPVYLLSKLVTKPPLSFQLKEITLTQTRQYIKKLKSSNTAGFDKINSRILKL